MAAALEVGRGSVRAGARDTTNGHGGVLLPRLGRSLALPTLLALP